MWPRQAIFDGRLLAARRHAGAAIKAAILHVIGNEIHHRRPGDAALIFIQRIVEQGGSAAGIAAEQIFANHAAGIGQPVREAFGFRQQQQARRRRAVGAQHHRLGFLEDFTVIVERLEIDRPGDLAAIVGGNIVHIGIGADFAVAAGFRQGQQRNRRTGTRFHLAGIARAHAAIVAGRPAHIGQGDDRRGIGHHRPAEFLGADPQQGAGAFLRQRRQRIGFGHGRDEGRIQALARDADFPLRLGVIGLHLGIAHRPIGDIGAGNVAKAAGFIEFPRHVTPVAGAIGHGAAADHTAITIVEQRRFFIGVGAEGCNLPLGIAEQPVLRGGIAVEQFVLVGILFMAVRAPAPLFQHHDRETGLRQLLGHDAAAGARTDDDKINLCRRIISLHGASPGVVQRRS